jgi:hypothetical protein
MRDYARIRRRIDNSGPDPFPIEVIDSPAFSAELFSPAAEASSGEGSPRDLPQYTLKWGVAHYGPRNGPVQAGERFIFKNVIYEATEVPEDLNLNDRKDGTQVTCMPIKALYPYIVDITEKGGDPVLQAGIRLAMWTVSEASSRSDEYEDFEGEAPIDTLLKRNRVVVAGVHRYNVMTVRVERRVPHIVFTARRAGG